MRCLISLFAALCLSAHPTATAAETICTLVLDAPTGAVVLAEGDCNTRATPASTFKVALAAMAFDAGILKTAHSPVMAFHPGDPDWGGANWTKDTAPRDWMRYSVLWYSQRITHAMGSVALTGYAKAFRYGNADFTGDPGADNGLERAWLSSSLLVSPQEQAAFLRALVMDDLPVTALAMQNTRDLLERHNVGDWVIHGKTGAAFPRRPDRSFDYARGWGWYVGWASKGDRMLVFARLTQARTRSKDSPGILTRDGLLRHWDALID